MPKKKRPEARNAVIYARFSSHSQNEASIDQQVEKCREYAAKRNITIANVYADKAMTGPMSMGVGRLVTDSWRILYVATGGQFSASNGTIFRIKRDNFPHQTGQFSASNGTIFRIKRDNFPHQTGQFSASKIGQGVTVK